MTEIPKAYEAGLVEEKWYDSWLKRGFFTADPARVTSQRPAYSIVIPPPNITGMLHMGHVLNNTIQDILARKARMEGKEVLWLPGTDHAGIATQVQVEKAVRREEKKTKEELGREEFLKRVWAWKEKHGGIIIQQLKKLGSSCDWTRARFTMDPEYSRCVQRVFVDLYQKDLIYRGNRMVNWCPVSKTALSDEEVEMKPQKGFMYHFRVQVAEEDGTPVNSADGEVWLTIATTRPETIPGDTAVAVNSKDPRYAHLIGKRVIRPLPIALSPEKKLIPIIADEKVDFAFGTGVLKVTPAHDKADFEIGQRHHLPLIDIMNPDGTMNDLAGESLAGLDRFEARTIAVERLKELGALVKEEPYENNVGFSQRADVPIEPRLSDQWFLKYPSLEKSKACVARGEMRFFPDRWAKVYDHWLNGIQDWCISRQLWWGHRIPIWTEGPVNGSRDLAALETFLSEATQRFPGHVVVKRRPTGETGGPTAVVVKREVGIAPGAEEVAVQLEEKFGFVQDPDVLDTWFSSWLWPFATMGWPEAAPALKAFYPTTDLVTGPDIIFFWVARMIMAGYEFMGDLPFRNVYFTGIIRDKQGRKMSKSLGNSPDPLDLISKYGADALRFGTMRSAPLGQDVLFDEKDVELGRNFCNKLWNACRFRQMQKSAQEGAEASGATLEVQGEIDRALLSSDDKWILLKLDRAIHEINTAFAEYRFNEVTQTLYRFFWSEYCDWYVEATKTILSAGNSRDGGSPAPSDGEQAVRTEALRRNTLAVLDFILSHTLRLFHPFLPFITEELWHGLGYHMDMPDRQGGATIQFAPWPKPLDGEFKQRYGLDESDELFVDAKYALVTEARNLRRETNVPPHKRIRFIFTPIHPWASFEIDTLRHLLNAEPLEILDHFTPDKGTLRTVSPLGNLYLPPGTDIDLGAERLRVQKELSKIDLEIQKSEERLKNPAFREKAPAAVLQEHEQRLAGWQAKREQLRSSLAAFEAA